MKVTIPTFIPKHTPNLSLRKVPIRGIVLHHTGGSLVGSLAWLCNPKSQVSADVVIGEKGHTYKLNPDFRTFYTWHAGRSLWHKLWNVNDDMLGVELEHVPGDPWPNVQVKAAAHFCAWCSQREGWSLDDHPFASHAFVAQPKGRKNDPEGFPWELFSSYVREFLGIKTKQ